MTTQPRISAPIGRVRIRSGEGGKRSASGAGRWKPADPPMDAEVTEAEEAGDTDGRPRFYPFPLRATDDSED
ncbi:MAG: hypothetical protein EP303_04735 [Deltaproteobacteria bacterium]|nr:MAG: hypothetical protein EP303_04735 [Deltaproteobacteria bacterium]UCF45732.1 MAG: hypothetical protein JSU89_00730 [Myxococcales bacterium]